MAKEYRIESLLRPVYEAKALIAWSTAAVWTIGVGIVFKMGFEATVALSCTCVLMTFKRGAEARRLIKEQLALKGKPVQVIPVKTVLDAIPSMGPNLWLGWGWRWQPSHTGKAYEVMKRDLDDVYPPAWLMRVLGEKRVPQNERGLQWIHGLEREEKDILAPIDSLKGHCAIIATTGAIKTRLIALIIPQLVARGDVVFVIDPKGDHELKEICRLSAAANGDENKFMMLHPAFASQSIRLDLLKNWDRVSQVASRMTLVLGAGEDSNFQQFCWMAVNQLTNAIKYVGRRVNLYTLKTAMESRTAVESLALEVMRKFFKEEVPSMQDRIDQELNKLAAQKSPKKGSGAVETSIPELSAMISVFLKDIPSMPSEAEKLGLPVRPDEIKGLVTILEANKEWFGKMIVSITPMLNKLTTDDLKALLSPDYEDITDTRPIMDMKRIVEGRHVLYMGTDALADPSVGKAMTAMALADMASVAAEIYNHGIEGDNGSQPRRIHLIVDEWGDAMCEPLVQQANKGRGAGVFIWALGQTFADLVTAFAGDVHSAKRFMGNMNNLIVGAIQDPDTVKMVSEKFGMTTISVASESKGTGSRTQDTGLEFTASHGTSRSDQKSELVPPDLLPQLPDLQYVALINRSHRIKGRIPVVTLN